MMAYNGWTNRATWNVELWFSNEESLYRFKMDQINGVRDPEEINGSFVRRCAEEIFPNGTPDMADAMCLAEVNWDEIADGWKEEYAL